MNPFAALGEGPNAKDLLNKKKNKKTNKPTKQTSQPPQDAPDGFTVVKKPPRKPKAKLEVAEVVDTLRVTEEDLQLYTGAHPLKNYHILSSMFSQQDISHRNTLLATIAAVCKCWYMAVNSVAVWKPKAAQKGYDSQVIKQQIIQSHSAIEQGKLWRKAYIQGYLDERRTNRLNEIDAYSGDEFAPQDFGSKKISKAKKHYKK